MLWEHTPRDGAENTRRGPSGRLPLPRREVREMRPELEPPQGGVRAIAQGERLVARVRCGR